MRILAYMDFLSPTGFGTVSKNVIDRMASWIEGNSHKLVVFGLNMGDRDSFEYKKNILVVNGEKDVDVNDKDVYLRNHFLQFVLTNNFDVIWIMNDIEVISPILPYLDKINKERVKNKLNKFKIMFYTPIDSPPKIEFLGNLKIVDKLITYTEYGKQEIQKKFTELKMKKNIGIIPHGVDTNTFKKLDVDKSLLRKKYGLPTDKFIFGNINRNNPRKDLGTTILAFQKFHDKYPNSCLYLHCFHSDPTGIKIPQLLSQLGLKMGVDVLFPNEEYLHNAFTEEQVNEVYNCLDCFVNTTMAEGWGLSVVEAMAVDLPIIAPIHTSLGEITDYGKAIENPIRDLDTAVQIHDGEFVRLKSNTNAVFHGMLRIYFDEIYRHTKYKAKKLEEYNWDKITDQFRTNIIALIKGV